MQILERLNTVSERALLAHYVLAFIKENGGMSHTAATALPLISRDFALLTEHQTMYTARTAVVLDVVRNAGAIHAWYYVPPSTLDSMSVDFVACVSIDEPICIQTVSTRDQARIHRNTIRRLYGSFDSDNPIIYILRHRDEQNALIPENILASNLQNALPTIQRIPFR